jgi:hypothetical protein
MRWDGSDLGASKEHLGAAADGDAPFEHEWTKWLLSLGARPLLVGHATIMPPKDRWGTETVLGPRARTRAWAMGARPTSRHRHEPGQPAFKSSFRVLAFFVLIVGAWAGCRCRATPPAQSSRAEPALRLVLVSGIAGAVEPCGCVKDMLGGVDHAAAYLKTHAANRTLVLGAGPMLFMDPALHADRKTQDEWKAEALVRSLSAMGMKAWAPGANDFAAGNPTLQKLVAHGPALLASNLAGALGVIQKSAIYTVAGVRVGVTGVSQPRHQGRLPDGLEARDALPALRASAAELKQQGASVRVLLAALPRGEALRLAELVPEFQVVLIGKPVDQGEANDPITPPTAVGRTLVVEAPNHLQAFYAVDFFVKDGVFEFANADAREQGGAELDRRIAELERRIADARKNPAVSRADVAARERDLEALKRERAMSRADTSAPDGSYYETTLVEVREKLGSDAAVNQQLSEYYRRVNEHNKVAFQGKLPPPVPDGKSGYVGAALCANCHQEEHAFWSKSRHAKAYETLANQHKQFNLDCVSCHVTGYGEPGGSTVAHVDRLDDVQCEVCHGPGSRHLSSPGEKTLIVGKPERGLCGPKCHHPPHVKPDWSVDEAWSHILGPGHGR